MSNDNQPDVAANAKMCKVCGCGFEASIHSVARESHRFVAANAAPEQDAEKWFGKLLAEDYQEHYCSHTFNGKQFAVPHGLVPKLLTAFAESVAAPLRAEIEQLAWNLGGCDTLAMGYGKPFEYSKEIARPALDSVSRLRQRAETLEQENSTLRQRVAELEAREPDMCVPDDVLRAEDAEAGHFVIDISREELGSACRASAMDKHALAALMQVTLESFPLVVKVRYVEK